MEMSIEQFLASYFPLFAPNSMGSVGDRAKLAVQSINQVFPLLTVLMESLPSVFQRPRPLHDFFREEDSPLAEQLKVLLDSYRSDKANDHDYHKLYAHILNQPTAITGLLEIGMGTNNSDVVSNMGPNGNPGASLRAFRDFLPNAQIFGADVDRRILFKEDRIQTYFVDQTDPNSFTELIQKTPDDLDLVIDDGLHSPNANLTTLTFALKRIKVGGWVVIEDIREEAVPVWEVVSALFPAKYEVHLLKTALVYVFAVQRIS